MKKIIIYLALFLATNYFVYPQNGWQWSNPTPSGNTIIDIHFFNDKNGIILNNAGEILKSNDCGESWQVKQTISSWNDMDFKESTGIVVGNSGNVLKSIDAGENWTEINIDTYNNFNKVEIISKDTIFIVSENKTLYKSYNGGVNWIETTTNDYRILDIDFINPKIGFAACKGGKIIKTINGGEDWTLSYQHDWTSWNANLVYFLNENVGFSFYEIGDIYKTIDGGQTWYEVGSHSSWNSVCFSNNLIGYVAGEAGVIYKSIDLGESWQSVTFDFRGSNDIYSVFFLNDSVGFTGGLYGRIMKTSNGGQIWNAYSPTYFDIYGLHFPSDTIGFSVGFIGQILKTNNGGDSWELLTSGTDEFLRDVHFINNDTGFVVGNRETILKTTDGGANWTRLDLNSMGVYMWHEDFYCIDFVDENIGFVSGGYNSDAVLKTNDGGNTWQKVSSYSFSDLQFINSDIGYAITHSKLYKTINGGIDWTIIYGTEYEAINSVYFMSDSIGYIAGKSGFVMKTIDGGEIWNKLEVDYIDYKTVHFYNQNVGYLSGESNYQIHIYKTIDGGNNWTEETIPYISDPMGLTSFAYTDNNHIFISGANGTILKDTISYNLITSIKNNNLTNYSNTNPFLIYPNPTNDCIYIQSKDDIIRIEVFNQNGIIYENDSFDGLIDLSQYPYGLYLIKIYSNNSMTIKKIIKK